MAGLTGLLWGGAVRMLVLHHVTYSINSLCHFFGRRGFATPDRSRNVSWLALPSMGESWHNNHHAFPTSAVHGLRWYEIDISALVISGAGEGRAGVGRRSRQPRAPGAQGGKPRLAADAGPPRPAARRTRRRRCRSARSPSSSGTGRGSPPPTASGPTFHVRSPAARGPRAARPGSARPRSRVRVGRPRASTTSTLRWSCSPVGAAGARRRARAHDSRSPPRAPPASRGRRRSRRRSCGRAAGATASSATRRAVRHHYDVSNEFFALFLDESMTYSCAVFSRGATDARGGPGGQARAGVHEARAAAGRARARRRLRLGQLRDPRRPPPRRPGHGHHALAAAGRAGAPAGGRRPASPTRSRSGWRTTASSPTSPSTRSPASAWSSTSARARSTATPASSRGCCGPAGGCSTTGSPALRHGDPEAGPFSERYVFPDAAPLHLSRIMLALERAGLADRPRRGLRRRLRRDAAPLGPAARREPRRGDRDWPAPSACASGGSTCAPRATAS